MPAINSSQVEEIVKAIKATASITSLLAKDKNNIYSIRQEDFQPVGVLFPQITINWIEGKSDSKFPSTDAKLRIMVWCDVNQSEPYKFLNGITDNIVLLFNRAGAQFNNIDQPTDTGVNFDQFVKISSIQSFEDKLRKFYSEIVFKVCSGEGQSYAASKAGDQPWV